MKPKLIRTETDYEAALVHIETLMDAALGSAKENDLEVWALLVEHYEQERFPIEAPDPVEAIKFRMDQLGLQQKDLVQSIGAKSKVSEVMSGKRQLSLPMIRTLHKNLGIPAAVLVGEPRSKKRKKSQPKAQLGGVRIAKKPASKNESKSTKPAQK